MLSTFSLSPDQLGSVFISAACFRPSVLLMRCPYHSTNTSGFSAAIGRLCEKCDGKCVVCDSYVRPCVLVRICDECNYGSYSGRCVICGGVGISDAYYCKECALQEKDVSARLACTGTDCSRVHQSALPPCDLCVPPSVALHDPHVLHISQA